MKLSDYVISFLANQGVRYVFELIGGAITHLLDSTYNRQDIWCISMRHEQGAAFAAEAQGRLSGNFGVAMATSGPGATNLITGIGSSFFDSIPCLYITGQVNTYEYKQDRPVRQIGFQETDIVSIVRPITKYATMIINPQRIRYELEKGVAIAKGGRPGPVLLDIPMDIQRAEIDPETLPGFIGSDEWKTLKDEHTPCLEHLDEVADLLANSERPLILAGGGVRLSGASAELLSLADRVGIPVVVSLMGLDVIPHDHSSFYGMVGAYGNRYSNLAVANSDLLIAIGTRLDTRITGTRRETFARGARVVHVDIDPNELWKNYAKAICIQADAKTFLATLPRVIMTEPASLNPWNAYLTRLKKKYPTTPAAHPAGSIDPNRFLETLSGFVGTDDIITVDVGQHQMWTAQSFHVRKKQRVLISGGMGAMGFALPAAIGACLAAERRQTIAISGDGGFQINLQELQTVAQLNLPIKMIVMNNHSLGMVRQFQEIYFNERYQSTIRGYSAPDFLKVAGAFGIPALRVDQSLNLHEVLQSAFSCDGPYLLEVELPQATQVNPKLMVNRPVEDMFPFLSRDELREVMQIPLHKEN